MTEQEFDYVRAFVHQRCALVLDSDKRYLVETRLAPLVREFKFSSLSELITRLRNFPNNGLATRVLEAMVTTETLFFRDLHPFEAMRKVVLPDLIQRRADQRRLTIWCAACSTGQEPYSLAMLLRESFPQLVGWNVKLLATDISTEVLNRAREGRYSQLEVNRGLPATLLVKYFEQHGLQWQLRPVIRDMVEFRELNLARPWVGLAMCDLILLRNVMIYFEVETKKDILGRIKRVLKPDGYLLLGGAETTIHLDDSYRRVETLKSSFYQLIG